MNKKHYLKHAILVLLTVFFSKLQATDYYWVGGTSDLAVNGNCWNTSPTATPTSSTGKLASGTFNAAMISTVNGAFNASSGGLATNTFDFNNKTAINCVGAIFTVNTIFYNRSGSSNISLNLTRVTSPTTLNSMTFTGNPTFNSTRHTFNLKDGSSTTATTVSYTQTAGTQYIYPSQYYTLTLSGDPKTISSGNSVQINNTINLGCRLNVEGTITLSSGITVGGSLTLGSWALQSTGTITDNRAAASKVFNHPFFCVKTKLPSATYKTLLIYASCVPLGNVTITGSMEIGDANADYLFGLDGYTLTMKDATLLCNQFSPTSGAPTTKSRIDATTGSIIIQNVGGQFSVVKDDYGTGNGIHDTGSIYHLQVDCDNTSTLSDPRFIDSTITINNITLLKGSLDIEDCVVIVTNNLTTKNGVGTIATLDNSNLGNPTHINMKKSTAKLVINNTTASLSTFDIDPTIFNENTIGGLYVDFTAGGNAVLGGDLIVNNTLDLTSSAVNYLKINGNTLTTNGTISSNKYRGTRLVGSSSSNFISGATGTVYFDSTLNENRTLKDLRVNRDAKLTLGNWLFITAGTNGSDYGKVQVVDSTSASSELATGNFLILQANSAGFAQVDVTDGVISGNMHVQTYFDGTHGRRYRFLSPQVTNGNVYSLRDSGSVVSAATGIKELVNNWGIQITGKLGANSTDDTSFDVSTTKNPSAFEFIEANAGSTGLGTGNDAGWKPLHSGKQTLVNGKGYRILVRGDRTIELTGTSGNASDNIETTTQITGEYVGASKTITLYNSGTSAANNGVNFIGNPYPATIDWDAVYSNNSSSGVDPTYVIYDNTSGSYASYNASSATGTASNLISSGQGFLVYTTTNNASLVIDESCKDVSGLGDRFFKKIRTNHLAIKMEKDANNFDRTILYFLPGSTTTYDKYDAGHIKNSSVNLASVDIQNNYYNINCLDTLGVTKSVPLTFDGTAIGTYTMSFEDCGTFWNHDIFLVDNYNKTTTKMDDVTKYSFSITSDPFSAQNGRLTVMFAPKEASATSKINKGQGIVISPNPINDKINLNIKEGVSYDFEITNIEGKVIKSGKLDRNSKSINANSLTNGIYFITLNSNSETQTIKFIK